MRQTTPANGRARPSSAGSVKSADDATRLPALLRVWRRFHEVGRGTAAAWGRTTASRPLIVLMAAWAILCLSFLPAAALYLNAWTPGASVWKALSRPLRERAGAGASMDVILPWDTRPVAGTVVSSEGEPCWSRMKPVRRVLSVEQVWTTTEAALHDQGSEHGVLAREPLHGALRLEQSVRRALEAAEERGAAWRCVRDLDGQCAIVSPLVYFNSTESALLSTPDLLAAFGQSTSWAPSGLPASVDSVFAGRVEAGVGAPGPLHSARWLATSFLLEWPGSTASMQAGDFSRVLRDALGDHGRLVGLHEEQSQRHLVLKVRRRTSKPR